MPQCKNHINGFRIKDLLQIKKKLIPWVTRFKMQYPVEFAIDKLQSTNYIYPKLKHTNNCSIFFYKQAVR